MVRPELSPLIVPRFSDHLTNPKGMERGQKISEWMAKDKEIRVVVLCCLSPIGVWKRSWSEKVIKQTTPTDSYGKTWARPGEEKKSSMQYQNDEQCSHASTYLIPHSEEVEKLPNQAFPS